MILRPTLGMAVALALLFPAHAVSAELDKFLPDDTKAVVSINVRQLVKSPIMRKYALKYLHEEMKRDVVQSVLGELDLNPIQDVHRVVLASSNSQVLFEPLGRMIDGKRPETHDLVIVHGKFQRDKIRKKVDELAKDNLVKIEKIAGQDVGVTAIPEHYLGTNLTLYVAMPDDATFLVATGRNTMVDALEKHSGKKESKLSPELRKLIESVDGEQSLWLVAQGAVLEKDLIDELLRNREHKENYVADVSFGLTITKELKLNVRMDVDTVDHAKDIDKHLRPGLNLLCGVAAWASLHEKYRDLMLVSEFLKTTRVVREDKRVAVTGHLPEKEIERLDKR